MNLLLSQWNLIRYKINYADENDQEESWSR